MLRLFPAFLISLFILSGCASAPRTVPNYLPPSVAPVRKQIDDAGTHVANAQTHAQKAKAAIEAAKKAGDAPALQLQLDVADREIDALTFELNSAQTALKSANGRVDELEQKVGEQTDTLNTAVEAKRKAEEQDKIDRDHAHRLKLYICLAGALAAFLVAWRFKGLLSLAGPYGAVAGFIGAPLGAFGLCWKFL